MNITAEPQKNDSQLKLGVTLLDDGCAFAVWAPHADSVSVVGDFNEWDTDKNPMESADGGTWTAVVEGAKAGQAYKFRIKNGEDEFDRVDPRALKVENSVGSGIIWKPEFEANDGFVPPTFDQLVVYELHIGSFTRTDGKEVGDFDGAIDRLEYLAELGINAIEVMPVAEFAGDLSWGYNPAHPFAVESAYGGPEAFQRFVRAAHSHGIAVILDVVYNHFGPSDLDLWRFDGWSENDKGGIYFFNDSRSNTPWGETRPDYGRREVRDYIRDNALMWIETYGVDGLRLDMTLFIRSTKGNPDDPTDDLKEGWSLLQEINDAVHFAKPNAIMIAEDLRDSEWLVKGSGAGGAGFNTQWCADFVHPIREALTLVADENRSMESIERALTTKFDGDAFKRVIYSESHDEVANGKARVPSEIDEGTPDSFPARKRSLLGAIMVMTSPGIPMLFQGQEFLEDEWFRDNVPLDWQKLETYTDVFSCYKDLVHLRRNLHNTTAGLSGQHIETLHFDPRAKTLSYHRWREGGPKDSTIVILNLSADPKDKIVTKAPTPGKWIVRFNSDSTIYGDDFSNKGGTEYSTTEMGEGEPSALLTVKLAPYSGIILSKDE